MLKTTLAAAAMIALVGRGALDGRTAAMILKSLGACAVVIAVDRLAVTLGGARLALDLLVYLALVVGTGALRIGEMWRLVSAAVRGRARAPT